MSEKDPTFAEIAALTIKAIRTVAIRKLSWLLEFMQGNPPSNTRSNSESTNPSDFNKEKEQEYINKIKSMQSDIVRLQRQISTLQSEVADVKDDCKDLRMRLNSVTGETMQYMDEIKKSLEMQISSEIAKLLKRQNAVHQSEPIQETLDKLYFESSSDGKSLINVEKKPTLSSNFIELDPKSGKFTIVQSNSCIEYILANRDYALNACESHVASANPTSIRVDELGMAVSKSGTLDWDVTKKMKITLY